MILFPIVLDSLKIQVVLSGHRNGSWEKLLRGGGLYLEMWKASALRRDWEIVRGLRWWSVFSESVDASRCSKNSSNSGCLSWTQVVIFF